MSFYGNSFYYAAESFACVVLQNSGLNKYITTLSDKDPFKEVPNNKPVELDALQRNSGLGVQSGNHWIKLASSGNTFQILHAAPGYNAEDKTTYTTIQGCVVEEEEPVEDPAKPVLMGWGKKIIVPMITYDATGHIIPTNNTTYLQMPGDPKLEMESRMTTIEDRMAAIDGEDNSSLKSQLKTAIDNLETAQTNIQNAVDSASLAQASASSAQTSASSAQTSADNAATQATEASKTALALGTSIADLQANLEALTERVKILEGNTTTN